MICQLKVSLVILPILITALLKAIEYAVGVHLLRTRIFPSNSCLEKRKDLDQPKETTSGESPLLKKECPVTKNLCYTKTFKSSTSKLMWASKPSRLSKRYLNKFLNKYKLKRISKGRTRLVLIVSKVILY